MVRYHRDSVMVGSKHHTAAAAGRSEKRVLALLPLATRFACVFEVQRARFAGDTSRGPVDSLLYCGIDLPLNERTMLLCFCLLCRC